VSLAEAGSPPPWEPLHSRLRQEIAAREAAGDAAGAESLRAIVDEWWTQQSAWGQRMAEALGVHHEINNALVGIRGNAQLLLMNPTVQQSGIRERLEVVLRESTRVQEAAGRLRELKTGLGGASPHTRAA
jgi:nitrogen-specific signal transduction histidine kinase